MQFIIYLPLCQIQKNQELHAYGVEKNQQDRITNIVVINAKAYISEIRF